MSISKEQFDSFNKAIIESGNSGNCNVTSICKFSGLQINQVSFIMRNYPILKHKFIDE